MTKIKLQPCINTTAARRADAESNVACKESCDEQASAAVAAATSAMAVVPAPEVMLVVDRRVAEQSATIKNMLQDIDDAIDMPIQLPNLDRETLEKVIDFFRYEVEHPAEDAGTDATSTKPVNSDASTAPSEHLLEMVCLNDNPMRAKYNFSAAWYAQFGASLSNELLEKMACAANYLDSQRLLDFVARNIAARFRRKTAAEIRTEFNITKDMTDEEEAAVQTEAFWCER
jgi:hypothetical protein